jgi:hypothetical protein
MVWLLSKWFWFIPCQKIQNSFRSYSFWIFEFLNFLDSLTMSSYLCYKIQIHRCSRQKQSKLHSKSTKLWVDTLKIKLCSIYHKMCSSYRYLYIEKWCNINICVKPPNNYFVVETNISKKVYSQQIFLSPSNTWNRCFDHLNMLHVLLIEFIWSIKSLRWQYLCVRRTFILVYETTAYG